MKQLNNAVSFKSIPSMWEIEEDGTKPSTARMVTGEEYEWMKRERPAEIFIVRTDDAKVFVRTITHVLKVGEWLGQVQILISWRHTRTECSCTLGDSR